MSIWARRAIATAVAKVAHSFIVVISWSPGPTRGGDRDNRPVSPREPCSIQGFSVLTFIPSFARVSPSARPVMVRFSDF